MTEKNKLHFTFSMPHLEKEYHFVVVDFSWKESLFAPFLAVINLASKEMHLDPGLFLDTQGQLKLFENGQLKRTWNGQIMAFSADDIGHSRQFYQAQLSPLYSRLTFRKNSRIFQKLAVPEILETLLEEMGVDHYSLALRESYPRREYCVQYNETDFDFLQRLLSEVGIYYYFEQTENDHIAVFCDHFSPPTLDQPLPYIAASGALVKGPFANDFRYQEAIKYTQVQLNDSNFKHPRVDYFVKAESQDLQGEAQIEYLYYGYPGRYKKTQVGNAFAKAKLQALRNRGATAKGQSNQHQLNAGVAFALSEHPEDKANRYWLVTEMDHQGSQPQALEEEAGEGPTYYLNDFKVVTATTAFKMDPEPKPQMAGPLIARVVGPEGEAIYCDEFGRVKIKFPWDTQGSDDEQASCWVRVAAPWAGARYGFVRIPRIGHEVLVDFADSDPDQPIIISELHNARQKPPYELPLHKTKTVWRSRTHQGEGYNEISFEDQAGQEQIFVHAQKDQKIQVNQDRITDIDHQEHLTIKGNQYHKIQGNRNLTVGKDQNIRVQGNLSQQVQGQSEINAGTNLRIESGKRVHIKAKGKVVIHVKNRLEFTVGDTSLILTPEAIQYLAAKLDTPGGSQPGTAASYSGLAPDLPRGVTPPPPPPPRVQPIYGTSVEEFATAENMQQAQHLCQQQSDGSCPLNDCPCGNNALS